MNRTRFCRITFGALVLAAGSLSASALATCTSTLVGSTATVTCDAATDNVQIGRFYSDYAGVSYWWHPGGAPFGGGNFGWDSNVPYQDLEATAASTINVHLAGGTLTLGILAPPQYYDVSPADSLVGNVNWYGTRSNTSASTT